MFFDHEHKNKSFCEGCTKNPTVHISLVVEGELTEMHLCADCPLLKNFNVEKSFGLSDLLAGLLGFDTTIQSQASTDIQCKNCGMTYAEFIKRGRLGCSECYQAFSGQLLILLKKIHGTSQHIGKNPFEHGKVDTTEKTQKQKQINRIEYILNLKDQMNQAVRQEDYERASKLRDMIHEIENEEKQKTQNNTDFNHN